MCLSLVCKAWYILFLWSLLKPGMPGHVAQSVTCLTADTCLTSTAESAVASSTACLLPSVNSRRAVVSYKRKYVHQVLANRLVKIAQEKCVVSWTDRPNMTIAVNRYVKHQYKKKRKKKKRNRIWNGKQNGMEHRRECNGAFLEYGTEYRMRTWMWNGTEVGWYAEYDCVISGAHSLTYGAEWNYEWHRMKHNCSKSY